MIYCTHPISTFFEHDRPCSYCGQDISPADVSSKWESTSEDGHTVTDRMHQECLLKWKKNPLVQWVDQASGIALRQK